MLLGSCSPTSSLPTLRPIRCFCSPPNLPSFLLLCLPFFFHIYFLPPFWSTNLPFSTVSESTRSEFRPYQITVLLFAPFFVGPFFRPALADFLFPNSLRDRVLTLDPAHQFNIPVQVSFFLHSFPPSHHALASQNFVPLFPLRVVVLFFCKSVSGPTHLFFLTFPRYVSPRH